MLTIKGLYKEEQKTLIKDMTMTIEKGTCVGIECDQDTQDLLFRLILGKTIPSKGEILIEDMSSKDYSKKYPGQISIIYNNDALYEHMTVESYLKFFYELQSNPLDYKSLMLDLALLDLGKTKIKSLTFSQKKRVSLAREMIKNPSFLMIQEPILHLDKEGIHIILENIQKLCDRGCSILVTSILLKDTLLASSIVYRLNEDGFTEINQEESSPKIQADSIQTQNTFSIEKIPAKIEDKILLFDPVEIDYIESSDGISQLLIRGEKFPCTLTLTELEERLKYLGFFRCHRSYLVNLQRVREVVTWTRNSYSLNLDDKHKSSIPLSKGILEELKNILKF